MTETNKLRAEIDALKKRLKDAVEKNQYDFNHPQVLKISKKLDLLILEWMQNHKAAS